MLIQWITIAEFRNYRSLSFHPEPGLNVLSGANAQGKTNLLEAMGVQASVLGNAEIRLGGREALTKLVASVHFPVLAANLLEAAYPTRLGVPKEPSEKLSLSRPLL